MRGSFSFNIVMLFFITIYLFMCGGLNSNFILNIIYFILISIINNYFKYPVTGYIITTIVFILIFFNFFAVPVYASDMEGSNAADATASKSIQINNEFTTPLEELLQYELFLNILILLQIIFLLIIIFLYNNFISGTNNWLSKILPVKLNNTLMKLNKSFFNAMAGLISIFVLNIIFCLFVGIYFNSELLFNLQSYIDVYNFIKGKSK